IIACNAPSTLRLLKTLGQPASSSGEFARYEASVAAFEYAPIATVTLQLEHPWGLPLPMLALQERRERLHFGQWLFDTRARQPAWAHDERNAKRDSLLHIVISDARLLAQYSSD